MNPGDRQLTDSELKDHGYDRICRFEMAWKKLWLFSGLLNPYCMTNSTLMHIFYFRGAISIF
jgi:hypothetical protein